MKTIFKSFLLVSLLFFANGCSDSWLETNVDPEKPVQATPELVLPSAVLSTAATYGGYYNLIGGFWSQYWAQSNASNQYKEMDGYALSQTDFNAQWREVYTGALNDYKYVKNGAKNSQNWQMYFAATVMECFTWQVLVDFYDQIPFNEALQGADGVLEPHYDSGELVYDSLIARLDRIMDLDFNAATNVDFSQFDYVFAGDFNQWIRFANTLKLKIYIRQMYARPTVAQNGIQALYAEGAQFLTSDAMLDIFIDQQYKDNPLYAADKRNLNTSLNLRASATLYKYWAANGDTRLPFLYGPAPDNSVGVPIPQGGYDIPSTVISAPTVSQIVLRPTDPVFLISTAESYFLQAEAVARGWGIGNDQQLYDNGVLASFQKWGLDGSSFIAVGGAYEYPVAGTFEEKQEAIIMAKWASMAGSQGAEAFFETNRTHYPRPATALNALNWSGNNFDPSNANYVGWTGGELLYSLAGVTGSGNYPKRLLFPSDEDGLNSNCPAVVAITRAVWWDKK